MKELPLMLATVSGAVVATDAVLPIPGGDGWTNLLFQLGVGGLVAVVAVRMLLALYKDKEGVTREYHAQLLDLTKQQIIAIHEMRNALDNLEQSLSRHHREVAEAIKEMRRAG
jgi:hypothetical protein